MSRKWPQVCHITHVTYVGTGPGGWRPQYQENPHLRNVECRVVKPRATEIERARTYQVQHMTPIWFPSGTDVRRHDRVDIVGSPVEEHIGRQYTVQTDVIPSHPGAVQTECERIERA